jgi:tRNA/rRNA methyltransferase
METPAPAFVLVEPQLAENVGAVARAMLNCGLTELRLVAPRDGWPNPAAYGMASGADVVLEQARLFTSVEEAIADLRHVYATTARHRDMVKYEVTPARAAVEMRRYTAQGERCGVLFGRERIGLLNEEVTLADRVVVAPMNPAFTSLNLAQAALLVGYEWFQADDDTPEEKLVEAGTFRAPRKEILFLFEHLEKALDVHGFFRVDAKRPSMVQKIRNFLVRAQLTEEDVRILHGIVTSLTGKKKEEL